MNAIKALIEAAKEHPPGISRGGRLETLAREAEQEWVYLTERNEALYDRITDSGRGMREMIAAHDREIRQLKAERDDLHAKNRELGSNRAIYQQLTRSYQTHPDGAVRDLQEKLGHAAADVVRAREQARQAHADVEKTLEALAELRVKYEELRDRGIKCAGADLALRNAFEVAMGKDKFSVTNDWPRVVAAFEKWAAT